MKVKIGRGTMMGAAMTMVIGAVVLALIAAAGIVGWEFSNSNTFCTAMCHAVHPEEPRAHAVSTHARVQCVECHMGRLSTLQLMALKPTHAHELWGMIAGYERPLAAKTMRPARDSCEACHWPSVVHHDSLRTRVRYDTDPKSTENRITLAVRTGSGEAREGGARGIHWHIAQDVYYATNDPQKRKIPYVEIRDSSGKVISSYFDPTEGVSRAEVDKMEKRRIDCIDCHNAAGHPFRNPADLVDEAIQDGKIARAGLTNVKARAVSIIDKAAGLYGNPEELEPKFKAIIAESAPKDLKPEGKAAEQKFETEMLRILQQSAFSKEGLSWKSFANHAGHKDSPGCFRCHDGKHQNEKGEAIRLQCTLCHQLPQVVREDGARTVASTVSPDMEPPAFHNEPNFMHDHRTKIDDSCQMCHGKLQWGKDGGNFCANPACHGRRWPNVNLDTEAPKPPPPVKGAAVAPPKQPEKAAAKK